MQIRVQFPSRQSAYGSMGNIAYGPDGVNIRGKEIAFEDAAENDQDADYMAAPESRWPDGGGVLADQHLLFEAEEQPGQSAEKYQSAAVPGER